MDVERELRPFRNLVYAVALFTACAVAILIAPADESPYMHTFFDAGIVVVSAVVALLLWDMGSRSGDEITRLIAVAIGINAVFELIHVLPALVLVPLLSLIVGVFFWRVRNSERLGLVIVLLSLLAVISNTSMLYSEAPADRASMLAHAARFANGVFLLFTLTQLGSIDTAHRIRAERVLTRVNEALEDRVRERTADLETANSALRAEATEREHAERKTLAQLRRLRLLQQTTHAIAERQDLASIFQVVVGSLEDHLNVDFACLCQYDQVDRALTVARVGANSANRAEALGLGEQAKIEIDDDGLGRCRPDPEQASEHVGAARGTRASWNRNLGAQWNSGTP